MAAHAAEQRVRTVVGLQARQAPAIEHVQKLLSDGYVGEVLSTTMVGLSVAGGSLVQPNAYMLAKTNGANLLTIAVGHSLDTLNSLPTVAAQGLPFARDPRLTVGPAGASFGGVAVRDTRRALVRGWRGQRAQIKLGRILIGVGSGRTLS